MKYLLVLICCLLATAKVVTQGAFSKKSIRNFPDAVFFIGLTFAFSSAIFFPALIGCSLQTWGYGALFGLLSMIFQLTYTKALSMGNVSLTVMISNFSMLFTVVLSATVYREPISPLRLVGILLTLTALVVSTEFKRNNKREKSWLLLALTALVCSGLASCVLKIFSTTKAAKESMALISCGYLVAAVATFLCYALLMACRKTKRYQTGRKVFLYAFCTGFFLAVFQLVYQYAIANVDGTFLFPAFSGASIILSSLTGILLFKDKLSPKQMLSLATGCAAVVLMNF